MLKNRLGREEGHGRETSQCVDQSRFSPKQCEDFVSCSAYMREKYMCGGVRRLGEPADQGANSTHEEDWKRR